MGWTSLTSEEKEVVRQCLRAAVEGPFFPEWEFGTIFGLERDEVAAVFAAWPDLDDSRNRDGLAVNNALNNLLGYPHRREERWSDYISASRDEVAGVLAKFRGEGPDNDVAG